MVGLDDDPLRQGLRLLGPREHYVSKLGLEQVLDPRDNREMGGRMEYTILDTLADQRPMGPLTNRCNPGTMALCIKARLFVRKNRAS